jgi:prepilin-type N-terminal cleavage/methylation domain-containing protein/prepilin-type processing-associated H-X9-DG protein
MHARKGSGFTLVELLVVIAIIGMLVALLLPAIQSARESGRRTSCSNNMKQVGLAYIGYAETFSAYPPPWKDSPLTGSFISIFPYCEYEPVYKEYNLQLDWNDPKNAQAVQTNIPLLVCPSAPANRNYISDYGANCEISSNVYTPLVQNKKILPRPNYYGLLAPIETGPSTPQKVTDGISHTFMLFEDGGRPASYVGSTPVAGIATGAEWADRDSYFYSNSMICGDGDQIMNCMNDNEIYSFHPSGCNFLFGDGAVRFLPERTNIDTFVSLFTRAASDNVDGPDSPFQ